MQVAHFTVRPVCYLHEDKVLQNQAYFAMSNKYFDRQKATDDYIITSMSPLL